MEEQVVQAGNQIYLYIGMGVTVAFVALDKAFSIFIKLKNGRNGGSEGNGKSKIYDRINENTTSCKLNKQAIKTMEENIGKMDERNEKDHGRIFGKLNEIIHKLP